MPHLSFCTPDFPSAHRTYWISLAVLCLWLYAKLGIASQVPTERRDQTKSPKSRTKAPRRRWAKRKETPQEKRSLGSVLRHR